MENQEIPEGKVLREDGCICPAEVVEQEVEVKKERKVKMETCPYDPRFPNQNTTYRCYYSFIDYQRCARLLGNYPGCFYFLKCYLALCPKDWQEKWFAQMENGTFPYKMYPTKPIIRSGHGDLPDDLDLKEEPPESSKNQQSGKQGQC